MTGAESPGPTAKDALIEDSNRWRPRERLPQLQMSEEEKLAVRDEELASSEKYFASEGFEVERPELKRWIYPEEIAVAFEPCLEEQGFTISPQHGGRGYRIETSPQQGEAYMVAEYRCEAAYYVDPRTTLKITPAMWGTYYDYLSEFLIPCMQARGWDLNPLPTRATYVATNGEWDSGYPTGLPELEAACPLELPTAVMFGDV